MVAYECGIAVIKTQKGVCKYYSTDDANNEFRFLFYDMNGAEDEIIFEDEKIQSEWCTLFVYMYSEESAFLLYVDRSTLNVTGARARVGHDESIPAIRQEAFNAAALLLKELPEKLIVLEEAAVQRESELTLLSVGEDYGR